MSRNSDPSRRQFLLQSSGGIGGIALAWLLDQEARAATSPYAAKATHFAPKVKRVVQIYAAGGVSHLDTFDHKPELAKRDGQELTDKGKIDTFFGRPGRILKSPFAFKKHGQSGAWVSSLLPHLAECVDEMTFLHAMVAKSSNHTPATFQMNTGFTMNGFPSLGAWLSYGLGSESQDLPAYVVMPDPRGLPAGGSINWSSGFLPATHQGVAFRGSGDPISDLSTPKEVSSSSRKASLELLDKMNRDFLEANPGDSTLAARVQAYEMAARMQVSIPALLDLEKESKATRQLYGLDEPRTAGFGRNCLLARRMLERGVRFVQLFHGGAFGSPRINWDAHENIVENHGNQAGSMDQPVAALIRDLKARGMLDDTLILWNTEFGRTPMTEGVNGKGRDHHQLVFTVWMAGAGLKRGYHHGASDEVGYKPVEGMTSIHDLHATILHLLGMDHKKLTFYHNGIQRRLTDVHGEVIGEILEFAKPQAATH